MYTTAKLRRQLNTAKKFITPVKNPSPILYRFTSSNLVVPMGQNNSQFYFLSTKKNPHNNGITPILNCVTIHFT